MHLLYVDKKIKSEEGIAFVAVSAEGERGGMTQIRRQQKTLGLFLYITYIIS